MQIPRADLWKSAKNEIVKKRGHAVYEGDLAGIRAIAVPILYNSRPIGAISVTGISSRMKNERHDDIISRITKGVRTLEGLLNRGGGGSWLLLDSHE